MTARTAARLAWSLCTGCLVGVGGVVVFQLLNGTSDLGWAPLPALLAFAVVGGLVASRQPRNSVGWLLLAVAVCMTVRLVGEGYARYALITAPGSLPGGLYGAWVQWSWAGVVAILAIFLPLYFPTGRLLSPRWRPVLWLGIAYLSAAVVSNALQPGPAEWLVGYPGPATRWSTCPRSSRCWMWSGWPGSVCSLELAGPSPRWWCGSGGRGGSSASS